MSSMDDLEGTWLRIADIVGQDKAPTLAELAASQDQQELAKTAQAVNQCPGCGSYRLDGMPPFLHERGCSVSS